MIFDSLKQKKLIFNFFVNRNWKKLTDSRKRPKILADNRKSNHPIETLLSYHLNIFVTLNPLKMFRINKEGLSMMSIIEHFSSDFSGNYRAFWKGKME